MSYVGKGSRIVARWFEAELVPLAGIQTKTGAVERIVTGVVRHIRGDHPTAPTTVRLYVETESGSEIEVDPKHVMEVQP